MRVLVCGSRVWYDQLLIYDRLRALKEASEEELILCHGGARGVDRIAGEVGHLLGLRIFVYPANWERYGRRAGFLRNRQMVEEFQPDLVLAFSEQPVTPGTQLTVDLARAAGIPVEVIGHH